MKPTQEQEINDSLGIHLLKKSRAYSMNKPPSFIAVEGQPTTLDLFKPHHLSKHFFGKLFQTIKWNRLIPIFLFLTAFSLAQAGQTGDNNQVEVDSWELELDDEEERDKFNGLSLDSGLISSRIHISGAAIQYNDPFTIGPKRAIHYSHTPYYLLYCSLRIHGQRLT